MLIFVNFPYRELIRERLILELQLMKDNLCFCKFDLTIRPLMPVFIVYKEAVIVLLKSILTYFTFSNFLCLMKILFSNLSETSEIDF